MPALAFQNQQALRTKCCMKTLMRQQCPGGIVGNGFAPEVFHIRGIGQDEIKTAGGGMEIKIPEGIHLLNASREMSRLKIPADQSGCRTVVFDKYCGGGSPAQGLDAERPASGKEIENPRTRHAVSK